jgi:hypothetical protein
MFWFILKVLKTYFHFNNGKIILFIIFKVFVSWKNLCKKRSRKISMIPLPVSPAFSMPSAGSSGSSTPTDELYSPVLNKHSLPPTQIPIPNSVLKRKKSLSAKNSPTGSMEKLSSDKLSAHNTGRRGSIY